MEVVSEEARNMDFYDKKHEFEYFVKDGNAELKNMKEIPPTEVYHGGDQNDLTRIIGERLNVNTEEGIIASNVVTPFFANYNQTEKKEFKENGDSNAEVAYAYYSYLKVLKSGEESFNEPVFRGEVKQVFPSLKDSEIDEFLSSLKDKENSFFSYDEKTKTISHSDFGGFYLDPIFKGIDSIEDRRYILHIIWADSFDLEVLEYSFDVTAVDKGKWIVNEIKLENDLKF